MVAHSGAIGTRNRLNSDFIDSRIQLRYRVLPKGNTFSEPVEDTPLNASSLDTPTILEGSGNLGLCLEIRRGQTDHPLRPILNRHGRFLIGGDDDCDLQLGGVDIPALHSLLQFDGNDLWIEAIAPEPQLLVNRQAVNSCLLRNGDHIEIGAFELAVRLDRQQQQLDICHCPTGRLLSSPCLDLNTEFDPDAVAELSAEELVDALDQEMQMIEHFDRRQSLGAAALLNAVQQHREQPTRRNSSIPAPTSNEPRRDASENLERRESAYLEAAAVLLEAQNRLAAQLEALEQQVAELRDLGDRRQRASA